MIKYAGMILIAAACTAGGFFLSNNIKHRLRQTEKFMSFFDNIIKYIDIYKYRIEKIFNIYDDKELDFFLDKLRKNGRIDGIYKNPWEVSLQECRGEGLIFFKDGEYEIIKEFGVRLGIGRAEEQIAHMNLYAGKLRELHKSEHERELNLAKLYRWSGGLIGLFICILLI